MTMIMYRYVYLTGSDTVGDGSPGNPWKTLNHALCNSADTDIIEMGTGTFNENIDMTGVTTGRVSAILKTDTIVNINSYVATERLVLLQGGTININSSFAASTRCLVIDNSAVTIAGSNTGDAVFYHCDIAINYDNPGNIYINSKITLGNKPYWLNRDHFMMYFCGYSFPLDNYDYLNMKVPLIDIFRFDDLFQDTYPGSKYDKSDYFPYTSEKEKNYPYDAYTIPFTSVNAPMRTDGVLSIFTGIDYGSTNSSGEYNQNEYLFILGDLDLFRPDLSIGSFIGKYNPANPNRVMAEPNNLESYIKNLFLDTFILDERLLYVQGIMNTDEMPENLSHLYDIVGMDIRSVIMLCQTELWQAAGSLLALVTLLESNNTVAGFDEYSRRHTCKIGRLPWRYDITTGGVYFRTYAEDWQANHDYYLNDVVVQRVVASGLGVYFWKALGAGTSDAAIPSFPASPTVGTTTIADNTVTWICDEVFNNDHEDMWRIFDFEKAEKVVRVENPIPVSLTLGEWNYIYADFDIPTDTIISDKSIVVDDATIRQRVVYLKLPTGSTNISEYYNSDSASLKTLFENEYVHDLRQKKILPIAFVKLDDYGNLTTCIDLIGGRVSSAQPEPWIPLTAYKYGDQVMAMVAPTGGTIPTPHYYRLESLTLTSGASSPTWTPDIEDAVTDGAGTWRCLGAMIGRNNNILLSEAEKGRAGQIGVDTNSKRNDAIIDEMFKHTFALDTQLYREGFPGIWAANSIYATGAKIFDTYSYECTRAGTSGNTMPPLVKRGVVYAIGATAYLVGDLVVKRQPVTLAYYYFVCVNAGTSVPTASFNVNSFVEDRAIRESGTQLIWKCLGKCSDGSAYEVKDNNYRWQASTRYKVNDVIMPYAVSGGGGALLYWRCTTAGITDTTTPTFSATTVTESTGIVWTAVSNIVANVASDGRDTTGDAKWKLTGYGDIEYKSFEN